MLKTNGLISIVNSVADLMSPNRCKICLERNDAHSRIAIIYKTICADCNGKISRKKFSEEVDRCTCCKRLVYSSNSNIVFCITCGTNFQKNVFLYSLYEYVNEIKNLVKIIKYKNDTSIAKEIANQLIIEIFRINRNISLGNCPLIVPIPSTPERIIERGFDSTYYITKQISRILKIPIIEFKLLSEDGNYKISNDPLTRLDKEQRKFKIKNKNNYLILKDKNIVVIDDVITTGSTAIGLAKFLQKMGAKKILILTIARSANFTKLYLKISRRS